MFLMNLIPPLFHVNNTVKSQVVVISRREKGRVWGQGGGAEADVQIRVLRLLL